jgi:4a-hydroxytetrahydrobiopterin dehydratase
MVERLGQDVIDASLKSLNSNYEQLWEIVGGKLYSEFKFTSFISAFGFMTQVAILAERANHHPEWSNIYNRVKIYLTTHEVTGISKRDFELAQEIAKII